MEAIHFTFPRSSIFEYFFIKPKKQYNKFQRSECIRIDLQVLKMVRKKVDNRIRTLIENGVELGHRTIFAIVGDKGRDQV